MWHPGLLLREAIRNLGPRHAVLAVVTAAMLAICGVATVVSASSVLNQRSTFSPTALASSSVGPSYRGPASRPSPPSRPPNSFFLIRTSAQLRYSTAPRPLFR